METTPPAKKAKRPYVYKRLLTLDELWKLIIPLMWKDFIRFFLTHWADEIDYKQPPVFLDKELRRLRPKSKSKRRSVDILMRVALKNGKTKTFLLHIEVQGYYDAELPFRVFQYNYRLIDLFGELVETFVLLLDEDADYYPNEFRAVIGRTTHHFQYPIFKLLHNPPPYIGQEDNPFSVVMEVAWHGLKQNMLKSDAELEKLRYRLIRKFIEKQTDKEIIYNMIDLISIYLPFADKKNEPIFEQKIESLIDDEPMEVMTIREYLVKKMEKKEIANAKRREKALEKRLQRKEEMYLELERKSQERELQIREAELQMQKTELQMQKTELQMQKTELQIQEAKKQKQEAEKQKQEAEKQKQEAEKREQETENLLLEEEQKRQLAEAAAAKNRLKIINTAKQLSQHNFSLEAIAEILSETTESVQAMLDEK